MSSPFSSRSALLLGSVLAGSMAAVPIAAPAQVTTSQNALDTLGSGHPHHQAPPPGRPAPRHVPVRHAATIQHPTSHAAAPARSPAPAATIPASAPPLPVIRAPVVNVPLHPPPPPPPVPVVQNATGTASELPDGTRITFGTGTADLDPATMAALHAFADRLKADGSLRVDLDARAAGAPDDPSTPRRVALSRGLAARAVLINDGIASTRIYVRVFGAPNADGDAPHDRVDLHAVGAGTTENPGGPAATGLPQPVPTEAAPAAATPAAATPAAATPGTALPATTPPTTAPQPNTG